jgi:hypothetical protein
VHVVCGVSALRRALQREHWRKSIGGTQTPVYVH